MLFAGQWREAMHLYPARSGWVLLSSAHVVQIAAGRGLSARPFYMVQSIPRR